MPIHARSNRWILETDRSGYAFGLDDDGRLVNFYWGERLTNPADYPASDPASFMSSFSDRGQMAREEYPAETGLKYIEPCFKAQYSDGVRDTVLRFERAEVDEDRISVYLRDEVEPLGVVLYYRVLTNYDLIERWAEVSNTGQEIILLERVLSAQWHLPRGGVCRLSHLFGSWGNEWGLCREPITPGVKVFDSRRITTSHQAKPWFAVDRGAADEENGEVWFGALAWSGNWKFIAEKNEAAAGRLSLGLNDWDFAWQLKPGETFRTPRAISGYTMKGFGEASRHMHDYVRDVVLPHGHTKHKVLYNSWEATQFAVDEASQARLAELAAEMGVELFVMDDGWFHRRDDDHAGLGDWWPDETKFPKGLGPLIERVSELGMDFGLWVEPEMVNPDSELYRAHPDWVIHFPQRARSEGRNQLILNFARPDVQDYMIEKLDCLLTENNISFIKWDMNRTASEPGWPTAPGDPREIWVRYVEGVYRVWGTLAERHPNVTWQACSGGGGRADLGILRLADQIWVSDQTEPAARLQIQEGFSQQFPACTMEAWVTDSGPDYLPLEFRMHVSMCGALGIGGDLLSWDEDRRMQAAYWIEQYKEIRPVVQLGDQYRLRSPYDSSFSAVQYVSKDRSESVLFAFRTHHPSAPQLELQPPVYPQGLNPEAMYAIPDYTENVRSGLAWMRTGIDVYLADFGSVMLRILQVK